MDLAHPGLTQLASHSLLGSLLDELNRAHGGYQLLEHWQQGEFHHDVALRLRPSSPLPGPILIVATNCNSGIKELLSFRELPQKLALWHSRCPENPEFAGELPELVAQARTAHWFNPCELLLPTSRSELREEFREREVGGGWKMKSCGVPSRKE
jgi:hypothetical protein